RRSGTRGPSPQPGRCGRHQLRSRAKSSRSASSAFVVPSFATGRAPRDSTRAMTEDQGEERRWTKHGTVKNAWLAAPPFRSAPRNPGFGGREALGGLVTGGGGPLEPPWRLYSTPISIGPVK